MSENDSESQSESATAPESSSPVPDREHWRHSRGLRRLGRFLVAILRKTDVDSLGSQASALAFATVLGLIPLLASFLWIGEHVFEEYGTKILAVLQQVLPYSEEALLGHIDNFLEQARAIRGFGLLGFAFVAILTFASVEETINRIWGITAQRPWGVRLRGFLLLLIAGPLMLGAVVSTLAILRTSLEFERIFQQSLLLQWVPAIAAASGLTLLYWLVPHTHVRIQAALAGAFGAAVMLGGLRTVFRLYLEMFPTYNLVYGGFALAMIFMLSIQLAWFVILLGAEISYGVQHWGWMSAGAPPPGQDPAWLGVVALLVLDGHRHGRTFTPREALADEMEVPVGAIRDTMGPLVRGGWVESRGRGGAGYRLTADLTTMSAGTVLAAYDLPDAVLERPLPKDAAKRIRWLRERMRDERATILGLSLATLQKPDDEPDESDASVAPAQAAPCPDSETDPETPPQVVSSESETPGRPGGPPDSPSREMS